MNTAICLLGAGYSRILLKITERGSETGTSTRIENKEALRRDKKTSYYIRPSIAEKNEFLMWNELPDRIKEAKLVDDFKKIMTNRRT